MIINFDNLNCMINAISKILSNHWPIRSMMRQIRKFV